MNITPKTTITFTGTLSLSEIEMRALDALVGYGTDAFLKVFYEHLGQHYMKPHESGLRSMFEVIRAQIPCELSRIDEVRKLIAKPKA